jgi:hypothetical protein
VCIHAHCGVQTYAHEEAHTRRRFPGASSHRHGRAMSRRQRRYWTGRESLSPGYRTAGGADRREGSDELGSVARPTGHPAFGDLGWHSRCTPDR